jgi:hypothetical protein
VRTFRQAVGGVMALVLLGPAVVRAQSDAAVGRAREYLENASRTKGILFFAHPEAQYQGIQLRERTGVVDGNRKPVPGHFALTYVYSWKSGLSGDNNTTELVFFFDQRGRFYALNGGRTSSFFRPFNVADVVVKEVRDQILNKVDRDGTEADRRLVRTLIQDGDARGLLTVLLRLDQP